MELPAFDPLDFKKFADGKTIVKDTDMDPIVENEAKLHITNGIEKASSATGVDIKVSHISGLNNLKSYPFRNGLMI